MTLTQLRYFCDVAETKNFTSSSKRLFVAQSSISFAILELEKELGVPLFTRGKKTELTPYGQKLLPYVQTSLASLNEGIDTIKEAQKVIKDVKIGVFINTTYYLIPWFLEDFSKTYPNREINISFQVQFSSCVDMFEPMVQGEYDLIITGCEEHKPNTESIQIATQPIKLLVCNDERRFGNVERIKFADLKDVPLVCVHEYSYMDRYFKAMFKASQGTKLKMSYVTDQPSLRMAVVLKRGIGVTTNIPVDNTHLHLVDIDEPAAVRKIFLSWPTNKSLTKSAAIVRDYFVSVTENHKPEELVF